MRQVYIAGSGLHPFGRFAGKTLPELGTVAARAALQDAGTDRHAVQAVYCGTVYGGVGTGHKVVSSLGATGVPVVNVEAGCASGVAALELGRIAVAAGQYDTVLVLGVEKMPKGMIRSSFFEPWQERSGLNATPAYFALRAARLMEEEGIRLEHLADVVVKNRSHGVNNPYAMFRTPVTREEVLASPPVCPPLHLLMLCSPNEGAAAVVLSRHPPHGRPPVCIRAIALRSHLPGDVLGEQTPMSGLADVQVPSPTERAAEAAYREAAVGPADLDLVECQDTDAGREILAYRELGLCPRGVCAEAVESGQTKLGGRLPVNVSGGLLSKGEPLGASGLAQVVEVCWQLEGRAGKRQVERARLGLSHTVGRGANAGVTILERLAGFSP